ncbi:glyoxalase [Taibaiella sp. KBW10]|uniref:VOC family protein n=1 Tax=Taibaiella sp. KBW10 TaxID=2153357 RepID=UPI000F5B7FF8|nr:VOC family protein [Taibaiella sp. KBW10]RQO32158.1 glyoxalase [Taibaiella sp. KBW10]
MKLGAFSVSLSVKDLSTSKQFYENLGFSAFAGSMAQHYLIMKNDQALIGLFQGMFEHNILTFNPGWDENAQNLAEFEDIRSLQQQLKSKGISVPNEVDEQGSGPAGFMITDPDGNIILLDQHR